MQFNFWWFTSDPGTNIIIATAIWFVLSVVCLRSCNKGQEIHPVAYIGYAISSFGMAFISVAGIYGFSIGTPFVIIGLVIVFITGRKVRDNSRHDYRSADERFTQRTQSEQQAKPASDALDVTCSECGKEVSIRGGTRKPDGSVVCPHCFKRFFP